MKIEAACNDKEQALALIRQLIEKFNIQPNELTALQHSSTTSPTERSETTLIVKLFAYLGSVFILGGLAALTSMFWDSMTSFVRVAILLVPGFGLYLLVALNQRANFLQRISLPLYILSYLLELLGLFTFLYEYFEHSGRWDTATLFVMGILSLQQIFTFFGKRQTVMLFCMIVSILGVMVALFEILHFKDEWVVSIIGISLLATTYFIGTTSHKSITGFWYFFAGVLFLGGIFMLLEHYDIDFLILLPTCFLVYFSTLVKSKTLLFVSIIGLFAFLSYFTAEYFKDSLGWPFVLLIIGVLLFALGYLGTRINRYTQKTR